jgi:hypothetical protein
MDGGEDDGGSGDDKIQIRRGDTMLQGPWIATEARTAKFERWKESILRRCDEIEKEEADKTEKDRTDRMDVDVTA